MTLKLVVDQVLLQENAEDLYEDAPCGYLSILEDGAIVKVNRTLVNWLGYDRGEFLYGKKFQDLLNMGGKIFFETHFAPLLKMQGFANEISFDLVGKNRQQIPILASAIQRMPKDGTAFIYRLTLFNITDRKKYERELLLERQSAEKAAKSKADFLSMMSHEIRTPMNAVIGIAHLLERTNLSAQQREYASMLKTSSENLMNLLNSILDFSKIEAGKISLEDRSFNLRTSVQDCIRGLESKAQEKGLYLKIGFDASIPTFVMGDPVKISQILTNFVGNALKFTERGGIEVSLLSLGNSDSVAAIRFEVRDTGIGISPERLPRIFDEFAQADYEIGMRYGGTGLGLAICDKLVEMHGSKIQVESELGQGSKFAFDLNMRIGKEVRCENVEIHALEESGLLNGLHVLIAEDNPENIFILSRLLRSWAVTFVTVSNGHDALKKLMQEKFDLVLMDLQMPGMGGYEATIEIRKMADERLRNLPIIAFSASTRLGQEDLVDITSFSDVLGKPFRPEDLFSKIAFYGGRSQTSVSTGCAEKEAQHTFAHEEPCIFTLETYLNLLEGDRAALNEILQLVVESNSQARSEMCKAMLKGNLAQFEFQAHRIKNSMEMLDARELRCAINRGRTAFENMEDTKSAVEALDQAFFRLIQSLQAVVNKQA